jgi:hypothetical protein
VPNTDNASPEQREALKLTCPGPLTAKQQPSACLPEVCILQVTIMGLHSTWSTTTLKLQGHGS